MYFCIYLISLYLIKSSSLHSNEMFFYIFRFLGQWILCFHCCRKLDGKMLKKEKETRWKGNPNDGGVDNGDRRWPWGAGCDTTPLPCSRVTCESVGLNSHQRVTPHSMRVTSNAASSSNDQNVASHTSKPNSQKVLK